MPRARLRLRPLPPRDCPAAFGNPWPDNNLTLSFVPDGTDVNGTPSRFDAALAALPADVRRREVLRAFQTWVAVADVNVGLVPDEGPAVGAAGAPQGDERFGDIRVAARPIGPDVVALAFPFDPVAGTRAGDVWLNADQRFTAAGTDIDLYSVALHEAGHVFGIAGSDDPESVMYHALGLLPRTGLAAADVDALAALYGRRRPDAFDAAADNGTRATATPLQPTGSHSADDIRAAADLTTASDADVYRFVADVEDDGGFGVTVATSGLSLLVPRVELLDATGRVLAAGTGRLGDADVDLRVDAAADGEAYFVRVTAADPTFAVGRYELAVRPDGGDDEDDDDSVLENDDGGTDDDLESANELEEEDGDVAVRYDYRTAASLSGPTDVDFYDVRSPAAGGTLTATVWVTDPAGPQPLLELYDRRGALVPAVVLVSDGGAYTLQLAAAGGQEYSVAVRHGGGVPAGNYTLGVDFGGIPAPLETFAAGTLTPRAAERTEPLSIPQAQVLHLVLTVAPAASGTVRLRVVDAGGRTVEERTAAAGAAASLNVALAAGEYRLAATAVGATADLAYTVRGLTVSDPIGPRGVPSDVVPVRPPTVPPVSPPPASPPPASPPPASPPPASPPPPVSPPPVSPPPAVPPVSPTNPNPPPGPVSPAPPGSVLRPAVPRVRTFAVGGDGPTVQAFQPDGSLWFALAPFPGWTGSVRTAQADLTGDGVAELIVGTGPGGPSRVRVLDGTDRRELLALAPFEPAFVGGVFVAAGDIDADGKADLIITPDEGGGPRVDVYAGGGFRKVASFFGIDDPAFRGGARAAAGDLNGDGADDLVVSAGFGGGPRIATFDGRSVAAGRRAKLAADFFAFETALRNGAYVAAGDIDADGRADLIFGGGPGGGPRVLALSGRAVLENRRQPLADFFAGDTAARDGVRVTAKDLDADDRADLVVGTAAGAAAYLGRAVAAGQPAAAFAVAPGLTGVYVG